ncbi:porin family protein [Rheinheimera sp. WS51]|uniref:porin family protein n=1 Tax=Rheinheimera sp. WS51 TaxID=3425886 RepID=UPI003D934451
MKKSYLAILATASLLTTSGFAAANNFVDNMGPYVGASYGLLKADGDEDFDKEDNATKLFIGAQFHQTFALEAGYIDFGNYGNSVFNTDLDGYTLAIKAGIPLGERFTLYAQGGNLWWNADINATDESSDADGSDFFYGAGMTFAISESWQLLLEYTRVDVKFDRDEIGILAEIDSFDTKFDQASLGVKYIF